MDWMKLFALLVAVASTSIVADRPKKKIRIHLPQEVKHIHHHKKIYITNHPTSSQYAPASSQYAPAYLPGAEGAVAVPTNVALPAVTNLVPLNSVELYEESQTRYPDILPTASKLLPLYRARGYYGPTHSALEEQEYDLSPPPESTDSYVPTAFSAPSASVATSVFPAKRGKLIKINELPRKKVIRKGKQRRLLFRGKPIAEDEHPVSPYHEQFYSDLQGAGTIRKVKKPSRVEKIFDGNTEHIHTFSEEHIHRVVDVNPINTINPINPINPIASMTALAASHRLIPIRSPPRQPVLTPEAYTSLTTSGSMGTPAHLEYDAYSPYDVTHDHIFHDHGEIPADGDIIKDTLVSPPKVSYNSQGLRISSNLKRHKNKYGHKNYKPAKQTTSSDFSYYENIYTPTKKPVRHQKITTPIPNYETSSEESLHDFRPIPLFNFKDKRSNKVRNGATPYYDDDKQIPDFRPQRKPIAPAPFSVSSTVVHDYKPESFTSGLAAPSGFTHYKDPINNFKDSYSNDFEYDTYASSSNIYQSKDKNDNQGSLSVHEKTKGKSISTQNISFGQQDSQSYINHLGETTSTAATNEFSPQIEHFSYEDLKPMESIVIPALREKSLEHKYYTDMALKAFENVQITMPEASNDKFHYVIAPTHMANPKETTPFLTPTTTTAPSTAPGVQETKLINDTRQSKKRRVKHKKSSVLTGVDRLKNNSILKDSQQQSNAVKSSQTVLSPTLRHLTQKVSYDHASAAPTVTSKAKYGDKI